MENQQSTQATTPPASSMMTRITNVFSAPTELYTEVASAPTSTTSWLIPYITLILIAIVGSYSVYNNPALRQQIYSMQEAGMKKAVAEGKMTQEQMDQGSERMENSGPVMFVLFGGIFQTFIISGAFFIGALSLWLATKFGIKSPASFSKTLEILGLSQWVAVLGAIIGIITMNLLNSMAATPGGGLLVMDSFDPMNKGHKFLAALNIFTMWQVGVAGIGVAKSSGRPTMTGMIVAYAVWIFWLVLLTLVF